MSFRRVFSREKLANQVWGRMRKETSAVSDGDKSTMKLIISDRALDTIEREARKQPNFETGGLVVGKKTGEQTVITHATGPGPLAILSPESFNKDTPYLQNVLNLLFHYFGVNYLGTWHKHPPDLAYPSAGDLASAASELQDEEIGLKYLLLPICTLKDNVVTTIPYVIDSNGYRTAEWEVVAFSSLLKPELVGGQWYETALGNDRVKTEISFFKEKGIGIELKKMSDGCYGFFATFPSRPEKLVFSCPNDYPAAPPEVVMYRPDSKEFTPVTSRLVDEWGIDVHLCDIYEEINQKLEENPS